MEYKHPYKTLSIGVLVTQGFILLIEVLILYSLELNYTFGLILLILLSILSVNLLFVKQLVKSPPGNAGVLSALGKINKEGF